MRKVFGTLVLAGMLAVPVALEAQGNKEFGVDFVLGYVSPDGGEGFFGIMTPVDVRIGFRSAGKLSFEPRFGFAFVSDNQAGDAAWEFSPTLNVLYSLGQGGTYNRNKYLTAGIGVDLEDDGAGSTSQFGFNVGIGMRKPAGSAATRFEAFIGYDFENQSDGLPSVLSIGARIGLSFWK